MSFCIKTKKSLLPTNVPRSIPRSRSRKQFRSSVYNLESRIKYIYRSKNSGKSGGWGGGPLTVNGGSLVHKL